jgi:hypothetical protein
MKSILGSIVGILCILTAASLPAAEAKVHLIELDSPPVVQGGCPATVKFQGHIETTGPLDVTFDWVRSDGARSTKTLHFAKAGRKDVRDSWSISKTYSGWEQIVITSPNQAQTKRSAFKVTCGNSRN